MSEIKKIKNLKEFSTSADRFEGANLFVLVVLTLLLFVKY